MIEVVTREKFYKDVAHEPLHPAVPKDPRTHHASSSAPAVALLAPPSVVVPPLSLAPTPGF
jgi:hypothetical protein